MCMFLKFLFLGVRWEIFDLIIMILILKERKILESIKNLEMMMILMDL